MPTATSTSPLELLTLTDAVNQSANGLTVTGPLVASGVFARSSIVAALTAFAGGGQGSATALTAAITDVTVCATGGDSVKLPTPTVGMQLIVGNSGAASMNLFPATSGFINAGAQNAQVAVGIGKVAVCHAVSATKWLVTVGA